MNKFLTTIGVFLFCANSLFAQVTVTINLNMSGIDGFSDAAYDLYVSGAGVNFGDWATPGSDATKKLTDIDGDNIYTLVLTDVPAGVYVYDYYKNSKGATEWGAEWPSPTGVNRNFTVTDVNMVINDQWNQLFNVNLNVDMNGKTFDKETNQVFVRGNIRGLTSNPGLKLNDENNDGIYSISFDSIANNNDIVYKYYIASSVDTTPEWDFAVEADRSLILTGADYTSNDVWGTISTTISDLETENVEVYPNPTSNILTIASENNFNFQIIDISGKILKSGFSVKQEETINLSTFTKGIYFVKVNSSNNTTVKKVLLK